MTGLEFGHFVLLFNIKQVAFSAETLVDKKGYKGKM